MIVACSACQNRFEAASYRDVHCGACGALAQPAGVRPCPRCELPLQAREVSDLVIDECSSCQGLFLDLTAVQRVIADDHHARAEALLAALPRGEHHPLPRAGGKMYIKCPTCSTVMNRKLFATGAGVVVDVCRAHGTFFDVGELPAILDFVQRGGLVKAAKKDAQRKAEREARDRADAERVRDMRGNVYYPARYEAAAVGASALSELLFSLFDS
ncbi:MAG TPA: zf-TFIIB domain-containing protein [Kofleriaceae bacterium]